MKATFTAISVISCALRGADDLRSPQLSALEDSLGFLAKGDEQRAIHALGDAIDQARRSGLTKTKPDVAACIKALHLLTVSVHQKGGAA